MAQVAWQPQESGVLQLCNLLSEFQKPGTNQSQIFQQLEQYRCYPDFNNYLAFIFSQGNSLPIEVRQSAGLVLKNNLKQQYAATTQELKAYIKAVLLPVLVHPSRPLRHTVGTIVSVIVGQGGLAEWPDLVSALAQVLRTEDVNGLDGALDTLFKTIEDYPAELDVKLAPLGGQPASCVLVPALLQLMPSPHNAVRSRAVACLNLMAKEMPRGLYEGMDKYVEGLFALANDSDASVRKEVVIGLVQLVSVQPDKLMPYIAQVIEYMLASNEHDDNGVALESCEFWNAFCEAQLQPELLLGVLPRLIPLLMKNMVFEEHDDDVQDAEAAELVQREDRDQDLKPFHHKDKEHAPAGDEGAQDAAGNDDDDDDDEEGSSRWTLRKCSAASLDRLSTVYGDDLLPVLLPIVEQRLQLPDWRARESAILALGAVSEGCHQGLLPHLNGMVAMLLPKLADPRPMVRVISCWALSRYSHWLLQGVVENGAAGSQLLDSVMGGVLRCVLDHNRYVQEAACSALATVEEAASATGNGQQLLEPHLKPILEHLGRAASQYGRRNLRLLYDALGTLAEAVGMRIGEPDVAVHFMPQLFAKFGALDPHDRDILPLMECLTAMTSHMRRHVEPYAKAIYEKALSMLVEQLTLKQAQSAAQLVGGAPGHRVEYDKDFVVCALDLVSGVSEALGPSAEALLVPGPLLEVLVTCCRDGAPDVRQSAFALLGDLSRSCVGRVVPAVPQLVAAALENLEPRALTQDNMRACNNACWSLGEMAIKVSPEVITQYAERIAEHAASILSYNASAATGGARLPKSILENSAITLGRVAWVCPQQLAPFLGHFCSAWCAALRNIRDDVEKEHAFLGLCSLVRLNPDAAINSFQQLCNAIASWRRVACEGLANELMAVMHVLKQILDSKGRWQQMLGQLDAAVQHKLVNMCHL